LSREKLRPYVYAGLLDPKSQESVDRVLAARDALLEMEEISVETLKDTFQQLAYLSSDEMPFMSKWMPVQFCAAQLQMHHSSVTQLFEAGIIPSFKDIHGKSYTTMKEILDFREILRTEHVGKSVGTILKEAAEALTRTLEERVRILESGSNPQSKAPAPTPAKPVYVEDVDEAWDAGIKVLPDPAPKPAPKPKPQPDSIPVSEEDAEYERNYVPPTPEEQAATVKALKERAKASFEAAEIARSRAAAAALAALSPEELVAKKAEEAALRAARLKEFMNKPR
jgi:hypothetical protein